MTDWMWFVGVGAAAYVITWFLTEVWPGSGCVDHSYTHTNLDIPGDPPTRWRDG